MWGTFSNIKGQLSQITQDVLKDVDENESDEDQEEETDENFSHEKANDFKKDVKILLDRMNDLKLENESLKEQKREISKTKEGEIQQLKKLNTQLLQKLQSSEQNIQAKQNDIDEQQAQIVELKKEIVRLGESNIRVIESNHTKDDTEQKEEIEHYKSVFEESLTRLKDLSKSSNVHGDTDIELDFKKIREIYESMITEYSQKEKEWRNHKDSFQKQISDLTQSLHSIVSNGSYSKEEIQREREKYQEQLLKVNQSHLEETQRLNDEIDNLKSENQKILHEYKQLQADVAERKQSENELINNQDKLTKDLSRLRSHLIEMEDNHTQELLTKEQRINELEKQIEDLNKREETLLTNTKDLDFYKDMCKEREQEISRLSNALNNMQNVLETLQSELLDQEKTYQQQISNINDQLHQSKKEIDKLYLKLSESQLLEKRCIVAEESNFELQQELSKKTRAYLKLQEEGERQRKQLEETLTHLTTVMQNEENLVDKRLASKLFMTYFEGKANKQEVLGVIAKIFNLTDEEKKKIGLEKKGSRWLLPIFPKGQQTTPQLSRSGSEQSLSNLDKTLTDLWVEFLLKETSSENNKAEQIV